MTILCDGRLINNSIEEFGDYIYLRVLISKTLSDEYAEKTEVWTQYKIKGLMNYYSADSEGVREGTYKTGEITFMLDTNYEGLALPDNLIYYPLDGHWYEIDRQRKTTVGGVTYLLEVTVNRRGKLKADTIQTTITSNALIQ